MQTPLGGKNKQGGYKSLSLLLREQSLSREFFISNFSLSKLIFFNKLNVTNNVMQRFSLPIIYDFINMKYWEFQIFWCQELSITFKNKGNRFVRKETLDIWSIKEKFVLYYMSFSLEIVMWLTSIVKYNKIIDNVWSMEC